MQPVTFNLLKVTSSRFANDRSVMERFFYELDFYVQNMSMPTLLNAGDVIDHTHFPTGHAGWMFEPLIWNRLVK